MQLNLITQYCSLSSINTVVLHPSNVGHIGPSTGNGWPSQGEFKSMSRKYFNLFAMLVPYLGTLLMLIIWPPDDTAAMEECQHNHQQWQGISWFRIELYQ